MTTGSIATPEGQVALGAQGPTEPIIDPSLEPFYEPPTPPPTPADGGVAPPDAPPQPPSYDPRTPERARESGVPWLGLPPGVEARGVPGGTPIITKAPLDYVPPPGYVLSEGLIKARIEARKPTLIGQKFGKLPPPPTPEQQAKWEEEARRVGRDPFPYVQQQWMMKHGLSVSDIIASGQILPGITQQAMVAGRFEVIPVPPPGTLAEPYDETKPTIKVYGERGKLVDVSRQTLWTLQRHLSPPDRIKKMAELGILPKDTQVIQFTAKQLEERGLSKAEAERAVEEGKNWGYLRKSDIEAQRLAVTERERALTQERITKGALAKLSRFKKEVGRIEIGGRVYRGKDVYDLFGILRAGKKDEAIEKAATALFGVRQVAQTKGALTKWENTLKSDFPKLHQVYEKGGIGAYNYEVEKLQAEYKTQQAALATLSPFKKSYIKWATDYGFPEEVLTTRVPYLKPEKVPTYNLVAAIKGGFEKEVKLLFPPKAIEVAQKIIREEEKVATREVARYTGKKWWYYDPVGKPKVITDEERKTLIKEKGEIVVESQVALYQPALILAVDPEWQTLRDRPKSDPERQAYQEKWGQKVADTIAFASLAATPWTGKAIGAVGMRLLPPILGGATRGVTFVATGGLTTKLPIIQSIPKVATQIIVGLAKLTAVGAPPALLTAHTIDEKNASDLQANWQEFRALPEADKDKWAREAGYPGYAKLTDPQKAVTLIHYSAPSKKALDTWLGGIGVGVDELEKAGNKTRAWLDKNTPLPVTVIGKLGIGVTFGVAEGLAYTAALPVLGASLADKAPRGEAKVFAGQVATGMAEFFAAIPALVRADPAWQVGRLTGLFILSPKAVIKLGKGLGYTINPAKIKGFGRAISIEFSTLRVPRLGEATKADMLKLSTQIVKQLAEGKLDATAKLGNFTVRVRNVPYQIAKPGRYWHFSTDITKFPEGKPIKLGARRLHLSPQAAMRFAITSAYGKPMKHPGLIELVVSKKYQPELYKTLGKGEIEIETAIRNRTLDYVSKRTEFSMELGSYPVHQYTLRGDVVKPSDLKLTPKEFAKIQGLVGKEVTLDMVLGWHGRMQRLKQMFAKDPRIKRIDKSITTLRNTQPEIIGKQGEVLRQRTPYPHPVVGGQVRPRVTAVVERVLPNKKRAVLLAMDKTETAWGLPGGMIDPKWAARKLGFTPKGHGKRFLTLAGSAHGQVKSETGIGLKSTQSKGIYLGKINRHAMSGSYVFKAKPDTIVIDRLKYQPKGKRPELQKAMWWQEGTPLPEGMYPGSFDVLKGLGYIIKGVKISRAIPELLKARDKAYGKRQRTGKRVDPVTYNQVEIKALQRQKAEIVRGRAPELADYFVAEPNWRAITELIMGRREAVKISKGKITPKAIRAIEQTPELRTPEIIKLIERQKRGETLTATELRQYQKAVDRAFEKQRQKLRETFDKASEYARRQYPHEYNRAYTYYIRALVAAMGRYRPVMGKRKDYARVALTELRSPVATRLEPYKPEIYEPVTPYKIPEPVRIPTKYVAEEKYDYPPPPPYAPPPTPYVPPPTLYVPPPPPPPPYKPPVVPPVPPPKPPPIVPPPPVPPKVEKVDKKLVEVRMAGAVAWRQGMLKRGKRLQPVWYVIYPPYKSKKDVKVFVGKLPIGVKKVFPGAKSAFRSIQTITGKPPKELSIDLGIFDVYIKSPDVVGEPGAIEYRRDPELKTFMDITMGKVPRKKRQPRSKRIRRKPKKELALAGVRG